VPRRLNVWDFTLVESLSVKKQEGDPGGAIHLMPVYFFDWHMAEYFPAQRHDLLNEVRSQAFHLHFF
jgi:hypothetical protein